MTEGVTSEAVHGAVRSAKGDWKSVASLLLALLIFVSIAVWGITGYVVRGADTAIRDNADRVMALESHQILVDSQISNADLRQREVLAEIKEIKAKLNSVSESQARMEGAILGRK